MTTARVLEHLIAGYDLALAGDFDVEAEQDRRPEEIDRLIKLSKGRRWRHLAEERLESVEPKLPLGKRFWALSPEERVGLEDLFGQAGVAERIAGLRGLESGAKVALLDAAYWMKGCSSLGRARYAAMLRVGEGKHARLSLIDLKEATAASAPRAAGAAMPRDGAERVVAGARALAPHLGERMIPGRAFGKPFVIRELMPQDLKLELGRLAAPEAKALANYLGSVVGVAHGRQMAAADRAGWRATLARSRPSSLEAPNWLWTSVVDLVAIHERAYLEHCRRYALGLDEAAA